MANMNLSNLLKQYGLEQKDLVEATGINKNTISKYVNNSFEKINKLHIDMLCKFFNCTPNDIFIIDDTIQLDKLVSDFYNNYVNEPMVKYMDISHFKPNNVNSDISSNILFEENPYNYNENETIDIEQQQARLDIEQVIERNLNIIIDIIISNSDVTIFPDPKSNAIVHYKNIINLPISLKLSVVFRDLFIIISSQYDDQKLIDFISKIRKIYASGGLMNLTDDMLMTLSNDSISIINSLSNKTINITKKD